MKILNQSLTVMNRLSLTLVAVVVAVIQAACFKLPEPQQRRLTAIVIALDQSTPSAKTRRCAEAAARLRTVLERSKTERVDALILGSGNSSTGFEPRILSPWVVWTPDSALFEHPDRADAARDEWIRAIRDRCEGAIQESNSSAIHFLALRSAESLAARCAEVEHGRAHCETQLLALHSDLRENVEVHTRAALAESSWAIRHPSRRNPPVTPVPRIPTTSMQVTVCGIADTAVGRGERSIEPAVVIGVWQAVLGVATTAFDASCPSDGPDLHRSGDKAERK